MINPQSIHRHLAALADWILKGAPSELSVGQPTKFEQVIKLETKSIRRDDPEIFCPIG